MMKFSLVIPIAPERNAEIIESIKRLDYPKDKFEVIFERGLNPSENRNRGADKAKGEIIVFLDDDAEIHKDYLKNLEKFLKKYPEIDVVGGPQLTPSTDKGFAKISGYALSSFFGVWKVSNRYAGKKEILGADEIDLTSANLACKKQIFNKIKFDRRLFPGEDPKFISDAKKQGFKVAYSPKIILYHKRRATIKGLMKQVFNYGKTRPAKESFNETLKRPFFFIPTLFIVYLIILYSFIVSNLTITGNIINSGSYLNLLFLPLIIYIALNLIFSIYDSINNNDFKVILILPFIYPLIHLSYGMGMIYGYLGK